MHLLTKSHILGKIELDLPILINSCTCCQTFYFLTH